MSPGLTQGPGTCYPRVARGRSKGDKMGKHKQFSQAPQIKTSAVLRHDTESKIKAIRERLNEIRQYKRLIAKDGGTPDREDKRIESELIVRLLYLEKSLKPKPEFPKKPPAPKAEGPASKHRARLPRRARGG